MAVALVAYYGNPKIKAKYIARVRAHRKADDIIKGTYGGPLNSKSGWRGCGIGCTIHGSSHAAYEKELGIPQILAQLEDQIFEGLPKSKCIMWPEQFLSAIRPGSDLGMVWPALAVWLLSDAKHGVQRYANTDLTKKAVTDVLSLYREWLKTGRQPTATRLLDEDAYAAADAAAAAAVAADARKLFWLAASQELLALLRKAA